MVHVHEPNFVIMILQCHCLHRFQGLNRTITLRDLTWRLTSGNKVFENGEFHFVNYTGCRPTFQLYPSNIESVLFEAHGDFKDPTKKLRTLRIILEVFAEELCMKQMSCHKQTKQRNTTKFCFLMQKLPLVVYTL